MWVATLALHEVVVVSRRPMCPACGAGQHAAEGMAQGPASGQEKVWQALRRRQGKGGGEGGGGEGRERNRAPCKASACHEEQGMASAACLEEGGIPSDARAQNYASTFLKYIFRDAYVFKYYINYRIRLNF